MKCLAKNCVNDSKKSPVGISFHRLPTCHIKQKVWLQNLGWDHKPNLNKYSAVCSKHFSADSFSYGKRGQKQTRTGLNFNAVPTIVPIHYLDDMSPYKYVNSQPQIPQGQTVRTHPPQTQIRQTQIPQTQTSKKQTQTKQNLENKSGTKQKTPISTKQRPSITNMPKSSTPKTVTETVIAVGKTVSNNSLNRTQLPLHTPPVKVTEQILMRLSNLDTQNLKTVINNSSAKFESALQAQARKKLRSELRKKLRNFNLNRDRAVNNDTLNSKASDAISSDVLKKIEELFKLDIFQGNESHEESSEVVEENETEDGMGSTSNDILSDTYMLLVEYGLIPAEMGDENLETIKSSPVLSETNVINVDDIPSVPRVYEDAISNTTNDDVILIEPRNEIITIGSPEHESPSDEMVLSEDLDLQRECDFENLPTESFLDKEKPDNLLEASETQQASLPNMSSLMANPESYLCSSILGIIKEYNANLQRCYKEKETVESKIASLQSQRVSLEHTITQIQETQTQLLELFLKKATSTISDPNNSIETLSGSQRKRRLSTDATIVHQDKLPRLEILEPNGNAVHSTTTITNSDQCSITSTSPQVQTHNFQDHSRYHLNEVKDIVKTNDYLVVSAGPEIYRYSCGNFQLEKVYKKHRLSVTGIYVLSNEYVFSVSFDMNLHKFSLEGFQNPVSTNCLKESLTALEYGWNNLFIGSARGRVIAFSIETNKICLGFHRDVSNSINTLKTVEVSNKKYLMVLTTKSLNLYICDAQTGTIMKTIDAYNYINDITVENDSIYCGLNSNELLTFSIFSGRSHSPKELETKSTIKCVKTHKNLVLIGCSDGYIHVYHKNSNLCLDVVRITDKGLINFEVFSRKIVFCSGDKSLTMHDMPQEISMYID